MSPITEFMGEYRFLSNFWPCLVLFEGMEFKSVEAAYVAAKTMDMSVRTQIQKLENPGHCKRFGRTLTLRPDWEEVKLPIMAGLLRQKFAPGSNLGNRLLSTMDADLIEGNWWGDTYWGVCRGQGENNLGKLLMEIRSEIA